MPALSRPCTNLHYLHPHGGLLSPSAAPDPLAAAQVPVHAAGRHATPGRPAPMRATMEAGCQRVLLLETACGDQQQQPMKPTLRACGVMQQQPWIRYGGAAARDVGGSGRKSGEEAVRRQGRRVVGGMGRDAEAGKGARGGRATQSCCSNSDLPPSADERQATSLSRHVGNMPAAMNLTIAIGQSRQLPYELYKQRSIKALAGGSLPRSTFLLRPLAMRDVRSL